jgi:hypothetical protein
MWGSPIDAELGAQEEGNEDVAQLSSSDPFFIIATTKRCPRPPGRESGA